MANDAGLLGVAGNRAPGVPARHETAGASVSATPFSLTSREGEIVAQGVRRRVPETRLDALPAALVAFGPGDIVGALPFDRERPAFLYEPEHFRRGRAGSGQGMPRAMPAPRLSAPRIAAEPAATVYAEGVRRALDLIAAGAGPGALRKIVLARTLLVEAAADIAIPAVLQRLAAADPSVNVFSVPLTGATLVGATPELLVAKTGRSVVSHPLAGSARRLPDAAEDRDAARDLLTSDKNRREHAAVVEAILDEMAPYCRLLQAPPEPEVVSTATLWHLATRITGELRDPDVSSLELATRLHPTPAVCGLPRDAAAAAIADIEPFDRGFYAGAVGWSDAAGDGRWYVTIRCAEIAGRTARLYAGAGIVAGSDPEEEVAETATKFLALLGALGIETPPGGL
jgi:isochorismate synthase